jgi:hypothetical protein
MRWHALLVEPAAARSTSARTTTSTDAQTLATQAVRADELRIALDLVETVIRDLYSVGLKLVSASQRPNQPRPQSVIEALDGIDQVIRTIRGVVFDLRDPLPPSASTSR